MVHHSILSTRYAHLDILVATMSINQFRSLCYRTARVLGDVQAARRGPQAMVRRLFYRAIYRAVFQALRRIL